MASFGPACTSSRPRSSFGHDHTIGCGRCPVYPGRNPRLCKILRGRGMLSRRLNPASFALTMRSLSQAPLLGGLQRASRVPFRASYFTPGVHPPGATAQRLTAYWYRQQGFPPIPSPRFVAHCACTSCNGTGQRFLCCDSRAFHGFLLAMSPASLYSPFYPTAVLPKICWESSG
jgi:hypothetical protein